MLTINKYLPSVLLGMAGLILWQTTVVMAKVPEYLVPSPVEVAQAFIAHKGDMLGDLWVTLRIALTALLLSIVIGAGIAVVMVQNKWLENALFPYVILIQVTPIVALAPLIVLLVKDTFWALVMASVLIAIFPIIANTTLGLKSVPQQLVILFRMYGAGRMQRLGKLQVMVALPYFLGGLKIASGLSIVGAVVGGFVAGTSGANSGLAYDILQDGYNLQVAAMFASVGLLTVSGVLMFGMTEWINWILLRKWHDSMTGGVVP